MRLFLLAYLVSRGSGPEGLGRKARAREGRFAKGHGGEQQLQQDGWGEASGEDGPDQGEPWSPPGSSDWAPAGEGENDRNLCASNGVCEGLSAVPKVNPGVVVFRRGMPLWCAGTKSWGMSWKHEPCTSPEIHGPSIHPRHPLSLSETDTLPWRPRGSRTSPPHDCTPCHQYSQLSVLTVNKFQ